VSVCFLHNVSKADAARIAKLDVEMSTMSSGNHLFWGQKVKVRVTSRDTESSFICGTLTPWF